MSIAILIISLVFALIETGLSWLLLAFEPVAGLFAGAPLWVVTGLIFAIGMVLTFVVIILVGSMNVSDRAATFVRDHFGRTLLLAVMSIIAVLVVSIGGEMLYQANPLQRRQKQSADIVFALDYSYSMSGTREASMKQAFEQAVNGMDSNQRICVLADKGDEEPAILSDWVELTPANKAAIIQRAKDEPADGGTAFDYVLMGADEQVAKALKNGRSVSVIMMSDGECPFSGVSAITPTALANNVKIHTIYMSDSGTAPVLEEIARDTGGQYRTSGTDAASLTQTFVETTVAASNSGRANGVDLPDTLVTPRWASRKTIINARVLRLIVLFLLGFFFKLIANICIGNNDRSFGTHLLHAAIIGILAACVVEFGYGFGLPLIAVLAIFWVLMLTQIVLTDR